VQHIITGPAAWTAALVLMALCEVVGRTGVLALRARATHVGLPALGAGRSRRAQPGRRPSIMDS
jgi:hypothetical protein